MEAFEIFIQGGSQFSKMQILMHLLVLMTKFNLGFRCFALIAKIWLSPILEFFNSIAAIADQAERFKVSG